jgi:hypothetical protein
MSDQPFAVTAHGEHATTCNPALIDYDPSFYGPIRELASQVELVGSPHGLSGMSDRELELWTRTCADMVSRPGRANGAQRKWRHLLQDAHLEQDARRTRRQRRRGRAPEAS